MATLTVYPDAAPESTSVDGYAGHYQSAGYTWAELIAALGTEANDSLDYLYIYWRTDAITDKWDFIRRPILLFDTSPLGATATIIAATLSVYGYLKEDPEGDTPDFNVYSSAPASDIAIAAGDLDSLGSTPFCDTPITYAGMNTGTPGTANELAFNAAGIAAIDKTGITKLGLRNANYDVAASTATWTAGNVITRLGFFSADKGTTYRPKLVITYTAATIIPVIMHYYRMMREA